MSYVLDLDIVGKITITTYAIEMTENKEYKTQDIDERNSRIMVGRRGNVRIRFKQLHKDTLGNMFVGREKRIPE